MKTLTKEQVELLANPDVKAIAEQYLQYLINNCDSKIPFDSFASQFTVEPELERKPRFVTNGDGEEIFDGDEYCYVNKKFSIIWRTCDEDAQIFPVFNTYFKSKEKATEYVLLNSPKLSVNEVVKLFSIEDYDSHTKNKLIELVKSKQ